MKTAEEWDSSDDLKALLNSLRAPYLRQELGERKFILFASACCRRIWTEIADPHSRAGVEAAERYADKQLSLDETQSLCETSRPPIRAALERLKTFEATAPVAGPEWAGYASALHAAMAANEAAACSNGLGALSTVVRAIYAVCCRECPTVPDPGLLSGNQYLYGRVLNGVWLSGPGKATRHRAPWDPIVRREETAHCGILRDIFVNPFRPVAWNPSWSTPEADSVAGAMYSARVFDRMPGLADVLERAGCDSPEVLGHCRRNGSHVRGCWVVDRVLGWGDDA